MKYSTVLLPLCIIFSQCVVFTWQVQVTGRCSVARLTNGKVRARARGRIVRFICNEGFTLVGSKYSTCVRGEWDTPMPVCVNAECPLPATPEHALIAEKFNGAILIYFCEPGYALIGASEIYCDGRQWNDTTPQCRDTNASAPTKCDFEKADICWWEQDPRHDFDWRRQNFETPSSHIGTGPTHDHTLGPGNDGYYMYVEASGRLVNDTARIMSPLYNASLANQGCFSFWYHMYGTTMGSLRIYFKQETDNAPRLMYSKDGNQGNQWKHGIFDLPKANASFQIIIEGVRGPSYVSDIAIDDVGILQGDECKTGKQEIASTTTNPTANSDDQIELIHSLQSCRGKCGVSVSEHFSTVIPFLASDACHCTVDCAETSSCCPDFAEYCVLGSPDDQDDRKSATDIVESKTTTFKTVEITTKMYVNRTTSPSFNTTPSSPPRRISIIPKDEIDPNAAVTAEFTPKPTTKSTMKTTARTTTQKRRITTAKSKNPEEATTVKSYTEETPFVSTTKAKTGNQSEGNPKKTVEQKYEEIHTKVEERTDLPAYVGIICAVLVVVIIGFLATALFVYRRRKSYKRGTNNSGLSEDSDVRFLTSDEILDFTLARPSENDNNEA